MTSNQEGAHGGKRLLLWLSLTLFVLAVLPRLYHLNARYMNFADHNTANFSIYARNLLEHGWLRARLGQMSNAWPADPDGFIYFAHHPPTVAVLASLSFLVLGVSEPAARILPLLASAATCPLIFLLGRKLLGKGWALLAALLFAASPGAIYYGQMLNPESFVNFLGLACLYGWCRYAETGRPGWWRGCLVLLAAAALTDWPGVYLVPAVAAASLLSPATRPRWLRLSLQAGATGAVALGLVFGHILFLKGSFEDLRAALHFRVSSSRTMSFSWSQYLDRVWHNMGAAVTPDVRWLAVAGVAVALGALAWRLMRRRVATAGGAGERSDVAPSIGSALVVFGSLHHVIFTNACYFNQNISYYLIPSIVLLVAAVPAAVARVLPRWMPRTAAAALAILVALPPVVFLARAGPRHVHSYFNRFVAPGWPILGQALNRVVPHDGNLLSTGTLSYPQFRHYAWRHVWHDRREPAQLSGYSGPVFLLRDVAALMPDATQSLLAQRPWGTALNFTVYDLTPGAVAPEFPGLEPPAVEWNLGGERFGEALALSLYGFGPSIVEVAEPGISDVFFGVPWTPESSAGRIVRASFIWERLTKEGRNVVPQYHLLMWRDGEMMRVPPVWPLEPRDANLAALEPGESARHDILFFFGEWLPPGEYALRVGVSDGTRLLPVTTLSPGPPRAPWVSPGSVTFRFKE